MDKSIFALCESITESELGNLNGDYLAQQKEDGDRIMAIAQDGEVILMNRRGITKNKQFREVCEELNLLAKSHNFIIDGEIIAENGEFNLLSSRSGTQNKFKIAELEKTIPILYMVFDIISWDSQDLRNKPLRERIDILKDFFVKLSDTRAVGERKDTEPSQDTPPKTRVRFCEYKPITEMLFEAKTQNWEGIVIKDLNGKYESRRSRSWLKLKLKQEVIIEFTKYETNNKGLRLSDEKDNAIQMSRFNLIPKIVEAIKTKGKVVCECECLEIFADTGKMRQGVFKRIVGEGDS